MTTFEEQFTQLEQEVNDIVDNPKDYNQIYSLFYQSGVPISVMRVDEPFSDTAKGGLEVFRVIDPKTWSRIVNRVSGANMLIHNSGKIVGEGRDYTPPEGHTWKSFTKFLLMTLPPKLRKHYMKRFVQYTKWWYRNGSPLPDDVIEHLEKNYPNDIVNTHAFSTRGNKDKYVIKFKRILDEIPGYDVANSLLTWNRFANVIATNDYFCKKLGFSITNSMTEKQQNLLKQVDEWKATH